MLGSRIRSRRSSPHLVQFDILSTVPTPGESVDITESGKPARSLFNLGALPLALEAAYWRIIAIRKDSGGGAKNQTLVRHHFQLHVRVLWHSIGLPRGIRANQPNRTDRSRSRPRSGLAFIISAGAVPPSRAVHSIPVLRYSHIIFYICPSSLLSYQIL